MEPDRAECGPVDVDMPVAPSQSSNSTVIEDVLPIKKVRGYTI